MLILKDNKIYDAKKQERVSEFNFTKGVLTAILIGITGSAMSLMSPRQNITTMFNSVKKLNNQ